MKKLMICLLVLGLVGCVNPQPVVIGAETIAREICSTQGGLRTVSVEGWKAMAYVETKMYIRCYNGMYAERYIRSDNGTTINRSSDQVTE